MRFNFQILLLASFLAFTGLISCNNFDLPPQEELLIVETAIREDLSLFAQAVNQAGLRQALSEQGPFTVFAPVDAAFAEALESLGFSSLQEIPQANLVTLLSYHVVPGRILSSQLQTGEVETFLESAIISINRTSGSLILNDSIRIIRPNIEALNGMIHQIDKVLVPPSNTILDVAERNNYTTFLNAIAAAELGNLIGRQGPFTVFIPTNAAFNRYVNDIGITAEELLNSPDLSRILSAHVIDGVIPAAAFESSALTTLAEVPVFASIAPNNAIWINGASRISRTNLQADNGLVHEIDYVISSPTSSIIAKINESNQASSSEFNILKAAIERAGLVSSLDRGFEDNVTIFAPTDEAFEALFESLSVSGIADIPVTDLQEILSYHLVPQRIFSQDLREGLTLPTLRAGQTLVVDLTAQQINDAPLLSNLGNIHGTNGVIHGIGKVLLPD